MKRDLICSSFKVLHVFVYWSNNVFEIVEYTGVGFFTGNSLLCPLKRMLFCGNRCELFLSSDLDNRNGSFH